MIKYTIKEVPEKWLIIITCRGSAQCDELLSMAAHVRSRAKDLGYHAIYNCKKAMVKLTAIECHCLVEKLSQNGLFKPKVGLVVREITDTCTWYQMAGWDFGLVVSFFTEFEDAYQWATRQ